MDDKQKLQEILIDGIAKAKAEYEAEIANHEARLIIRTLSDSLKKTKILSIVAAIAFAAMYLSIVIENRQLAHELQNTRATFSPPEEMQPTQYRIAPYQVIDNPAPNCTGLIISLGGRLTCAAPTST